MQALHAAGFVDLFLAKLDPVCLTAPGVELREVRLLGTSSTGGGSPETRYVMYRGPFEVIVDNDGIAFQRGKR